MVESSLLYPDRPAVFLRPCLCRCLCLALATSAGKSMSSLLAALAAFAVAAPLELAVGGDGRRQPTLLQLQAVALRLLWFVVRQVDRSIQVSVSTPWRCSV